MRTSNRSVGMGAVRAQGSTRYRDGSGPAPVGRVAHLHRTDAARFEEDGLPSVKGRVAFVTGGASGLGRATCTALAAAGAQVVAADIDMAGAESTVAAIAEAGGSAE